MSTHLHVDIYVRGGEGEKTSFNYCQDGALAKTGHGPHSSKIVVLFYVLFVCIVICCVCVCKCVLYCSHRVTTQLHLTNIYYYYIKVLGNILMSSEDLSSC
jgi:hypothetical protein